MIVKKPYGFLIKHFKIIHFLLLVPMLFVALNFKDIASFFNAYVRNRYSTGEIDIAGNYITMFTYLALFFLIIANSVIYLLMKSKKKNTTLYLVNIIYYIFLIVCSILFYATMGAIETDSAGTTWVSFVRDLARICAPPSYALMFALVLKGIGFNIKTFRIDNNVDLQVTDEDEEEIEIKLKTDTHTLKKNVTHVLREFKYYILENKFVFTCIGVVIALILFVTLYMEVEVYNKKYNMNQAFALDTFTMTLKESYITDVDYSGENIAQDTYFLAVKMGILNKKNKIPNMPSLGAEVIDKDNFRLFVDNKEIYPNFARSGRFIDVGKKYEGEKIFPQSYDDYVFVYELSKDQIKRNYQIKILSGLKHKPGQLIPSYKIINIRPSNVLKKESIGEVNKGTAIDLVSTTLGGTKYKLNDLQIANFYNYEYQRCDSNGKNCKNMKNTLVPSSGKTLVLIKDDITWDENVSYYKNSNKDIYADFAYISYDYPLGDGTLKNYTTKLKNVTPQGVEDVKIYEVSNMLLKAEDIKLNFKIRNQSLVINPMI